MRNLGAVLVVLAGCGRSVAPLAIPKPSEFSPDLAVQIKSGEQATVRFASFCANGWIEAPAWETAFRHAGFSVDVSALTIDTQFGRIVMLRFRKAEIVGDLLAMPAGSDLCWSYQFRVQRLKPGQLPQAWTTPFRVPILDVATPRAVIFSNDPLYAPESP